MAFAAPLAIAAAVGGSALSAYGSHKAGISQKNASMYAAEVARNNSIIAGQRADYATKAGQTQATATSLKGAAQLRRIKVAQAASGIDVNAGSAVDVQASQREVNKLDTETVLHNAELQAYGYRAQAKN